MLQRRGTGVWHSKRGRTPGVDSHPIKTAFLEFEQPIAEFDARIEELRYVRNDSAADIADEIQSLTLGTLSIFNTHCVSKRAIRNGMRRVLVSGAETIRHLAGGELSRSHYRLLMQVENSRARDWYVREAANQRGSTRQLDRQISVLYSESMLARSTARKACLGSCPGGTLTVEPHHLP